jgi:hypothetical protein
MKQDAGITMAVFGIPQGMAGCSAAGIVGQLASLALTAMKPYLHVG